jgi:hypothetical protein
MPRVNQLINVTVTESASETGKRCLGASIEANAALFVLSDQLAKEGAIRDLNSALRCVLRDAVAEYIGSGREFIKGIAKQKKRKSEAA